MENQRVVVITGVSGGLGPAVAKAFSRAGYQVAGVSRKPGTGPYEPFAADLTSQKEVQELARAVLHRLGRVDVLAHVAGGFAGGKPIHETDPETWTRRFNLNVGAAFHVIREFLVHIKKSPAGRIIGVGSRAGVQISANSAAYNASKAAFHVLIQTVAAELVGTNVTANAVLPSVIDTSANRTWGTPAQIARWVAPEAIANVMVWLASNKAKDVNGALIPVYGAA
jgi:NAD(P)-dependent dehydrogenase (short-subunit alcohol dehydrogenase family)